MEARMVTINMLQEERWRMVRHRGASSKEEVQRWTNQATVATTAPVTVTNVI